MPGFPVDMRHAPPPPKADSRPRTRDTGRPQTSGDLSTVPDEMLARAADHDMAERQWRRELTDDGKVFYFNPATGASQWHIPNELYRPRCLNRDKLLDYVKKDELKMPGSARAVLGVDCITEVSRPDDHEDFKNSIMAKLAYEAFSVEENSISIANRALISATSERVLRVRIVSARGLRDADFMPGVDKSDPYCTCEIIGKSACSFTTHVVKDCLDPVWNYEHMFVGYEEGDSLLFTVWDADDVAQDRNMNRTYSQGQHSLDQNSPGLFMDGDECLGKYLLCDESALRNGKGDYWLDDAGEDIEAYLHVETRALVAWPSLVGCHAQDAAEEIKRQRSDLDVQLIEEADPGDVVVFYDQFLAHEGYKGNFIGVYADPAAKLSPGCTVEVAKQKYEVESVDEVRENHILGSKYVVYVYFTTPIKGVIRNNMRWKKVTRQPEPGDNNARAIVWFDGLSNAVTRIPYIG